MPASTSPPAPDVTFGTAAGAWVADKQWSPDAEDEFSRWIEQLGRESLKRPGISLGACLADPAVNSLHRPAESALDLFADCADLPMVLRAYFSCRTRRPFQYVSAIEGDRYTAGNHPTRYRDFTQSPSLQLLIKTLVNSVHTGFYRTAPDVEGTDTYPIDVSRQTVRPGAVFYDPNGHVLIVYRVEDDGTVRMMDGHPDNSLTHNVFGAKFVRGGSSQGGGFRGWRASHCEGAGASVKFIRAANAACPGFSAMAQHQDKYDLGGGRSGDYYQWVQSRLARAGSQVDPVRQFSIKLAAIAADLHDRVAAVDKAIAAGIHKQPHPAALPPNIYGATGDWETYATPSRDARLRASFRELWSLVNDAAQSIGGKGGKAGAGAYQFAGDAKALAQALTKAWNDVAAAPAGKITWQDSAGHPHTLGLADIQKRLFALSFDPYHGPELRWGARPPQASAAADADYATAADGPDKIDWYWKEQRLRNVIDRAQGDTPLDAGPATSPSVDVPALIASLGVRSA